MSEIVPVGIAKDLRQALRPLRFGPPVSHVYDPSTYAWKAHRQYLERYARAPREVVLIGMNPGPWGMAQTGVPFGEINAVRDWLRIDGDIRKPEREHPKRPVDGWACLRSEVSGLRLWSWAQKRFKTPQRFFSRFFVANYCPLLFMEPSGRNLPPDKLPARSLAPLTLACDRALRRLVEHFKPLHVVGIGGFAEARAREALVGLDVKIGRILHPSPASPAANRNWAADAERMFRAQGIKL